MTSSGDVFVSQRDCSVTGTSVAGHFFTRNNNNPFISQLSHNSHRPQLHTSTKLTRYTIFLQNGGTRNTRTTAALRVWMCASGVWAVLLMCSLSTSRVVCCSRTACLCVCVGACLAVMMRRDVWCIRLKCLFIYLLFSLSCSSLILSSPHRFVLRCVLDFEVMLYCKENVFFCNNLESNCWGMDLTVSPVLVVSNLWMVSIVTPSYWGLYFSARSDIIIHSAATTIKRHWRRLPEL